MSLLTSIKGYWKLDESSGDASDSVGSATLTNVGTIPYASAKINNGVTGDGSSSYLHSGTTEILSYAEMAGAWTINLWAKRIGTPVGASYAYRINAASGGTQRYFILYYYLGGGWHINTGGADSALTYSETGNLDMLTMVYDGAGTIKFYVNGSQSGSNISFTVGTGASQTNKLGLCNDPNGGGAFNIQIDEVGIWAQALSTTDITTLYNGGTGFQYPFIEFIAKKSNRPLQAISRASSY